MNDLLLKIKAAKANQLADEVPAGWRTVYDLEKEWGLGYSQARRNTKQGVSLGILEKRMFRIIIPYGETNVTRLVAHYREVDKAN